MSPQALVFFVAVFCIALLVSLRRLEHGVYLMAFTAPFMDIFKSDAFGVQLRANEVIPLAVFAALLVHVAMGRARFRTPLHVNVLCLALLVSIVASLLANFSLENIRVEEEPGRFSLQSPTAVGIKTLIHATACVLVLFTVSSIASRARVLSRAIQVMLASTALVCVWSLLNLCGIWLGVERFGIVPMNVWRSGMETRVRGTLDEPSYFANYLGLMLPIVFFCWVARRRLFSRGIDRFILALLGVTLMLTFSAGGWFILLLFVVLLPLLAHLYGYRMDRGARAITALAILGACVIGFINEFVDPRYGQMLRGGVYDKLSRPGETGSGSMRLAHSRIGLDFFLEYPLFGIGPNMLHFRWEERATEEERNLSRFSQGGGSMWAFQAAELGLVGIIPVLGLFGACLVATARAARRCRDRALRPLLIGLLAGLLACSIHYLAHETLWWPYVWIYLGLVVGATQAARALAPQRALRPAPARGAEPLPSAGDPSWAR